MSEQLTTPWFAQGVVIGDDKGRVVFSGLSSDVSDQIPLDERRRNAAIAVSAVNAFAALAEHLDRDELEVDLVAWYEALVWYREYTSLPSKSRAGRALSTLPHDTVDRAEKE